MIDEPNADELIEICRKSDGEYVTAGHPVTSWATSYSNEFVDASFRLYLLFRQTMYKASAFDEVLYRLNRAGVGSCRRAKVDKQKLQYIYDTYWLPRLKRLPNKERARLIGSFG